MRHAGRRPRHAPRWSAFQRGPRLPARTTLSGGRTARGRGWSPEGDSCSERRPGQGGPFAVRLRMASGTQQLRHPLLGRRTSRRVRCSCSCSPRSPRRSSPRRSSTSTASAGSRFPAQRHSRVRSFGSTREAHAVVDAVHVALGGRDDVAALAVGVVHDRVEDRHAAQAVVVAADERGHVDRLVAVDPELHHARARTAPRAASWAGRRPSRSPPTRGRPRSPGRPGCRRGSPRAAAPPRRACRRRPPRTRCCGWRRAASRCSRRAAGPRGRSRPRPAGEGTPRVRSATAGGRGPAEGSLMGGAAAGQRR